MASRRHRSPSPPKDPRAKNLSGDSGKEKKKTTEIWYPDFDPRFPHQNQTRRCWQNYVDFHRCQKKFGEDDQRCFILQKNYKHLCPNEWIENWDELRANGAFAEPHWEPE